MTNHFFSSLPRFLIALAFCFSSILHASPGGIEPKPLHYDMPDWFKSSFLDIPVDVQEAADRGKRLLVFFHLENCPYCAHLLSENFTDGQNRELIERKFDVIAINVKGDLPVTWIDGTLYSEKQLARKLGVFATPAVLILGPKPVVVKKIMGYKKPADFMTQLQ